MKKLSEDQAGLPFDTDAPAWVYDFVSIGPGVRDLLGRYVKASSLSDRFGMCDKSELKGLAKALSCWSDIHAATLLEHLLEICKDRPINAHAIAGWAQLQENDPEAVSDCMDFVPPTGIVIIRRLPRTGSQKLVFEARWPLFQRHVVLKRLRGTALDVAKVQEHELHSHPLSIRHPRWRECRCTRQAGWCRGPWGQPIRAPWSSGCPK